MGLLTGHAAVDFRSFMLERRELARFRCRAVAGVRDDGRLMRAGARGHACTAARHGRYRTKAERADR
jgi:hypothetical protein